MQGWAKDKKLFERSVGHVRLSEFFLSVAGVSVVFFMKFNQDLKLAKKNADFFHS